MRKIRYFGFCAFALVCFCSLISSVKGQSISPDAELFTTFSVLNEIETNNPGADMPNC